jgi:hypothetical protein
MARPGSRRSTACGIHARLCSNPLSTSPSSDVAAASGRWRLHALGVQRRPHPRGAILRHRPSRVAARRAPTWAGQAVGQPPMWRHREAAGGRRDGWHATGPELVRSRSGVVWGEAGIVAGRCAMACSRFGCRAVCCWTELVEVGHCGSGIGCFYRVYFDTRQMHFFVYYFFVECIMCLCRVWLFCKCFYVCTR